LEALPMFEQLELDFSTVTHSISLDYVEERKK
jgi:hypothetical protein